MGDTAYFLVSAVSCGGAFAAFVSYHSNSSAHRLAEIRREQTSLHDPREGALKEILVSIYTYVHGYHYSLVK